MYEAYYKEMNPEKRMKILNELKESADVKEWELRKRLFDIRYTKTKKGDYADEFLRGWLELRVVSQNLDHLFSERKNVKLSKNIVHRMCLDQTDVYSEEVLYQEMCNLTGRYISSCLKDTNYSSFLWGLGKISDKKVRMKIESDLKTVGETSPEYLNMQDEFRILSLAITNMKKELLEQEETEELEEE